MSEVVVRNVSKSYGTLKAAENLNLTIVDGEFLSLLGPSGCGKTTLLRLIAGLITPEEGEILIGGKRVNEVPTNERNLAMVFQNYSLFPHMNVFDNVNYGLKIRGLSKEESTRRVGRALEMVRLPGYEKRYPRQLSGGQQQRVALARAIVYEPQVLLLDEPFGALDRKLRGEMQIELKNLHRELGVTTIFVTHDQEEALIISHRIAVMLSGRIEQIDSPEGIYERPVSAFVSDFIGITNLLSGIFIESNGTMAFQTENGLRLPWVPVGTKRESPKAARISIRPEKIELTLGLDTETALCGRVLEKIYLGSTVHFYVEFEGGDRIIVILPASRQVGLNYGLGDPIALRWPAEEVIVLEN